MKRIIGEATEVDYCRPEFLISQENLLSDDLANCAELSRLDSGEARYVFLMAQIRYQVKLEVKTRIKQEF